MTYLKSQRDEPDTQREYETIYILRPDADSDQIHTINTRVRKIIEDQGGKVIRVDNWGKRKLAYEIRKQLKGIYLYWLYLGESTLVAEIERNLRMLDPVIRHYTVKVEEGVNPEVRPSQMDEESFAATATTVPDEEDTYLGRSSAGSELEGRLDDEFSVDDDADDVDVINPAVAAAAAPRPRHRVEAEPPAAATSEVDHEPETPAEVTSDSDEDTDRKED